VIDKYAGLHVVLMMY